MKSITQEAVLVLHNIRSAHNVGSLFRTADAAGVGKVYLSGYTPLPIDTFGRVNKEIAKTALGAEKSLPWVVVKSITSLLRKLKKEKYFIVAIEQDERAVSYRKITPKENMVFILGNEVTGVDKKILNQADVIAEIPMRGKKESLNVSAAGAVALFQILRI